MYLTPSSRSHTLDPPASPPPSPGIVHTVPKGNQDTYINSFFLQQRSQCTILSIIIWSELGTFEWDTFNPNFLIRISNVNTLISYLIHSFLDILQENHKTGF